MSTLFVVATPIGNLEDITFRALRVLQEVDFIACEDTRTTKKLLKHYEIGTPTLSFHTHSGEAKFEKITDLLVSGKKVALVTDAGTPAVSDPGALLVARVRSEFPEISIQAVPGASAVTAALSVAGIPETAFIFLGFAPHKKGRQTFFEKLAGEARTQLFYESPHRILKTLEALRSNCPERKVSLARELTKLFEEVLVGTPAELLELITTEPRHQKGEFVVLVHPF